jgi:hypothetical protein
MRKAVLIRSAFREHVSGEKSDAEIASVIASSTTQFNDLSRRINRCETALKDDLHRDDLAAMIRHVQEYEKAKFEAVWQCFTVFIVDR